MRSWTVAVGRIVARALVAVAALAVLLTLPALASAHLERPSYWPDPTAETLPNGEKAGGKVPELRTLGSAVTGAGPGQVRVVCRGKSGAGSVRAARRSIAAAVENGYRVRPSAAKTRVSKAEGRRLIRINRDLADQCRFSSIQRAINRSGNSDRVVVMPGRYLEKRSRKQPTNDPRCEDLTQDNGHGAQAPSYAYQVKCPNDQNLVYVQGRKLSENPSPEPPLEEREGIPDLGKCIRCNLQLEGSGVSPSDVVIDAGRGYAGKGRKAGAKPGRNADASECSMVTPNPCYAKDVVLRVDRADGFVVSNLLTKSSTEHGIYIEETDGYLLDRTKMFWSAEYGNLTFTSDHGLYRDCDSYGAGDAAIYPGASPETGVGIDDNDFYPKQRINTVVRRCDMRSSALAYSGSQGNAIRITHSDIYANTSGIVTDSASASGHPGYPPDSNVIDHNNIYSNNLNTYVEDPPFVNTVGLPLGVGIVYPGVNYSTIRDNHIFDNWRRGTMLFGIPDQLTRGEFEDDSPSGRCPVAPGSDEPNPSVATACGNVYKGNVMGAAPKGFKPSPAVGKFGNPNGLDGKDLNGVDFWWAEFPSDIGNCWTETNVGPDGTHASITSDPVHAPTHGQNVPKTLPEKCDDTSVGSGDPVKAEELAQCAGLEVQAGCVWFQQPSDPESRAAARERRAEAREARAFRGSEAAAEMGERLRSFSTITDRAG